VIEKFKQFLEYSNKVTNNYSEKGLNSILDGIGSGKDLDLTEQLYQICLEQLKNTNNEVFEAVDITDQIREFGLELISNSESYCMTMMSMPSWPRLHSCIFRTNRLSDLKRTA
jgi:hypothetical protein